MSKPQNTRFAKHMFDKPIGKESFEDYAHIVTTKDLKGDIDSMSWANNDKLIEAIFCMADRALLGKGLKRHGSKDIPFHEQPIVTEGLKLGTTGHVYQIRKKALETERMGPEQAAMEFLDIALYSLAAYIVLMEDANGAEDSEPNDPQHYRGDKDSCCGGKAL